MVASSLSLKQNTACNLFEFDKLLCPVTSPIHIQVNVFKRETKRRRFSFCPPLPMLLSIRGQRVRGVMEISLNVTPKFQHWGTTRPAHQCAGRKKKKKRKKNLPFYKPYHLFFFFFLSLSCNILYCFFLLQITFQVFYIFLATIFQPIFFFFFFTQHEEQIMHFNTIYKYFPLFSLGWTENRQHTIWQEGNKAPRPNKLNHFSSLGV